MQWEFIVALVLGIPVILFPVVFVWYLNIGGIYAAIQEARRRRAAHEQRFRAAVGGHQEEKEFARAKH